MRKLVVMRPTPALQDAFDARDFEKAANFLTQSLKRPGGVRFYPKPPTWVRAAGRGEQLVWTKETMPEAGFNWILEAEFETPEDEEQFLRDNADLVEAIYSNPKIEPCGAICPGPSIGTVAKVREQIRIKAVHDAGNKGQNVRIAVVDTGIHHSTVLTSGGLHRVGFPPPGTAQAPGHGTMVAFDTRIAAPGARILDYPLLRDLDAPFPTVISDAILVYNHLIQDFRSENTPMVVVNSWAMFDRTGEAPDGSPQNYSNNPHHPFNIIVGDLVREGADVVFAAGNCGASCPDQKCGVGDRGPAKSILGANSHPDVISVAAVATNGKRLGYSSQGPGKLHGQKPDLCASSHFSGANVGAVPDRGTSAACGVMAGVVAALRSKPSASTLSPAALKQALLDAARQPATSPATPAGWNADTGFGIVDAKKAWDAI